MTSRRANTPPAGIDPVDYIEQTRMDYEQLGFEPYRWADNPTSPSLAKLPKPLSECRLALIASGGIYRRGQVGFSFRDDTSYRRIPTDVDPTDLRVTHFAYDVTDARRDSNVVFPLRTLKRLFADGVLGSLATHALTFMGGIYSQRRVRDELTTSLAEEVRDLRADIALLVPV